MLKTFETARKFNLVIQPEFILLQKTLLNIEGLGRQLYPELDIWKTSKPVLSSIMRKQYGMDGAIETIKNNLPRWLEQTSEIPTLVHEILSLQARPLTKLQQIEEARSEKIRNKQLNKKTYAILASGFGIISALLYVFQQQAVTYLGMSVPVMVTSALTLLFMLQSLKN